MYHYRNGRCGGFDQMSGGDWWWMGLMVIFWLAVLVLLVWAMIRFGRILESRRATAAAPVPQGSASEILDRRYAAGEIDAATYTDMRDRLDGRDPGS